MFTDGLTETDGQGGTFFGEPRLRDCVRQCGELSPDACATRSSPPSTPSAGAKQQDDQTIVIIDRLD